MTLTAKTLSALLLGAALVTPALAQDAPSANNGNNATAQTTPGSNTQAAPMAAPTTPVDQSTTSTASNDMPKKDMAKSGDTSMASTSMPSGNSQMAMNTTGNAADLSSVPDTQKKYSRANRAKDYKTEAAVTAQLNQKASSMGNTSAQ